MYRVTLLTASLVVSFTYTAFGQAEALSPRPLPETLRSFVQPAPLRLAAVGNRANRRGALVSLGVRRSVSATPAPYARTSNGLSIVAVAITSPGARQLRVHLSDLNA